MKERQRSERFKKEKEKVGLQKGEEPTDLEWLLNFVEYDEYKERWEENINDKSNDEHSGSMNEELDYKELQLEITSESDQEYT
ncbi:1560_t:CDS:2 [Cetraspora pellucida]|uniref:1560_t:CDS:1 n=1 Tax=Cetraspora pellucida TaxID=1433469 RepID=A0A9N9DAQ0_9GLOM|nr:1560_t:CDS:2 [Cetraspora pellucida]